MPILADNFNFLMPVIFLLVLFFIVKPPKTMPIYLVSLIGALLTFSLGFVKTQDFIMVINTCWDAIITLIGLMIISVNLQANKYFEWVSYVILKMSRQNGYILLILLSVLTSFIAAILANDGAVLIMTPLTFAITKMLNFKDKTAFAYLFTVGFLCDAASTPLLASNLTNILFADAFSINYINYARNMLIPTLIVIIATISFMLFIFNHHIPQHINLKDSKYNDVCSTKIIITSSLILLSLILGFIIASFYKLQAAIVVVPISLILASFNINQKIISLTTTVRKIDWSIVIFAISLFIIIVGLYNSGNLEFIKSFLNYHHKKNILNSFSIEIFLSIISSLFNNLPACLVSIISLKHLNLPINELDYVSYIAIFGTNIGSKLLPYGSLSTMLWLDMIKEEGYSLGWKSYFIYSIPVTILCLILSILTLSIFIG